MVVCDNDVLEKPAGLKVVNFLFSKQVETTLLVDAAAAMIMLRRLSGRRHRVISGVALSIQPSGKEAFFFPSIFMMKSPGGQAAEPAVLDVWSVSTDVEFAVLSDETIAAYIATGEPLYVLSYVCVYDLCLDDDVGVHLAPCLCVFCLFLCPVYVPFVSDKAGGYGMQSLGAPFVVGVTGCWLNVIGLPLHSLCARLLTHAPVLLAHVDD